MPKIKGKVLKSGLKDNAYLCLIQINGRPPKPGEHITLKWGSTRTLSQNALLWVYYTWLINDARLKEQGFFCPEALHASLKAHFLSEKIMSMGQFRAIEEGTTTTLTKSEFSEYFEKVDQFVCEFFGIDTSPFWDEHKEKFVA